MFNFPFLGYPYNYQYYRNYKNYNNYSYNKLNKGNEKNSVTNLKEISNTSKQKTENNNEQAIFNIMGISIYLDDLIILSILFFLYQEKVHDEMLYIILFLLFFSWT